MIIARKAKAGALPKTLLKRVREDGKMCAKLREAARNQCL